MNIAFDPQVVPALYFLLMGSKWGLDRFGDIWAGIIVKKIFDHLGYSVNSGEPFVVHHRASNVWDNLQKEISGLEINEELWKAIDKIVLHENSIIECYKEIAHNIDMPGNYWEKSKEAMLIWADLF